MGTKKRSLRRILKAIKGTHGIKSDIQKKLKVCRNTLNAYLAEFQEAQDAYDEECEEIGDIAESVINDDIMVKRNIETAKWYARMKLSKRGYVEKQQIEHEGSITVNPPAKIREPDAD